MIDIVGEEYDGYLVCEAEGEVHLDVRDPHCAGPIEVAWYEEWYGNGVDGDSENWRKVVDPIGYTQKELMFYTCPGPHYSVVVGPMVETDG